WAFFTAALLIVLWGASYTIFVHGRRGSEEWKSGFDTWQLVINTATTIITFLMVFLIQNTQNRDAKAIHLKLDELIRAVEGARTGLVDLENCTDEELQRLHEAFQRLKERQPAVAACAEAVEEELDEAAVDGRPAVGSLEV